MDEPLRVVSFVTAAFDRMGVRYAIGGSVASSRHGTPRATLDVDVVAELRPEHVAPLVAALSDAFYVDADAIAEAVARRGTFNALHLDTMFKVDVFVAQDDAWSVTELARAEALTIDVDGLEVTLRFATAEDTLLHKLGWYRRGGETSDRQWGDVLGLLRARPLDDAYLDHWAATLGVADLLARARAAR